MKFVSLKARKDPLYRNSFFLMTSSIARAVFGFLFWIIATAFYSMEQVGIATAILSVLAIIVAFSKFGLDQSMTREIPRGNKASIIYTSTIVTMLAAVAVAVFAVLFVDSLIPEITIVKHYFIFFILFVATSSVINNYTSAFIALRRSDVVFYQGIIGGARLLLLIPLVFLGAMGIVLSELVMSVVLVVLSIMLLTRWKIPVVTKFDKGFLKETLTFSAGNYAASFIATIPSQIISVLIIAILGPNETAAFYIGFMVFQLVLVIPTSISTSLFVEGSHGVDLKSSFNRAMKLATLLLIPVVILTYILGEWVLGFLGHGEYDYASGGGEFLRVIVLSSFFVAVYSNYISFFKVEKDVKSLVGMSAALLIMIVVLSIPFLPVFGIVGVGYAWILSHLIIVIAGYPLMRKNLRKDKSTPEPAKAQ